MPPEIETAPSEVEMYSRRIQVPSIDTLSPEDTTSPQDTFPAAEADA